MMCLFYCLSSIFEVGTKNAQIFGIIIFSDRKVNLVGTIFGYNSKPNNRTLKMFTKY